MYKLTQSKILIALLTLSLLFVCFIGCGEDADENGNGDDIGEAPELPPDSSMTINLSEFGADKLEAPGLNAPLAQVNYTVAKTTVIVVNAAVITALVTPVAIFTAAKNETPVEQDDGSWLWTYKKAIGLRTFTANLTGKKEGDKNVWSMKVSSDAVLLPLDNFEWYTGVCAKDNTSGSWQFFDPQTPDQANPTVAIDWQVGLDLKGVKSELTFTNKKADSAYHGDVLKYNVEGNMASISHIDASENTESIIQWDLETTAGSITGPDGNKACWDEDKQDVACE